MLIIFISEVAGAVVLLVFRNVAEDLLMSVEEDVKKSITEEYGSDESLTSVWNSTMSQFTCCGFRNYTDFDGSPFNNNGNLFPSACCNSTMVTCTENLAEMSDVDGCFNKLLELIEHNAVVIAAVALGIIGLEVAAMLVSMVLYKDIGHKA